MCTVVYSKVSSHGFKWFGGKLTIRDLLARHVRLSHDDSREDPSNAMHVSTALDNQTTPAPFEPLGDSFGIVPTYDGDDFTSFLDSISLPNHPYSPSYQPLPFFPGLNTLDIPPPENPTTPSSSVLPRHGTQLPSLQPEGSSHPPSTTRPPKNFVPVTAQCRDRVVASLHDYANVLSSQPPIPSRHALSRCLTGYFIGFHDHYPFVHVPTFNVDAMTLPLFLSMAALGARYCREPDTSNSLYQVAKPVTLEFIRRHYQSASGTRPDRNDQRHLETLQALLMLTAASSWLKQNPPFQEALYIRSFMETLARQDGLNDLPGSDGSWESAMRRECVKRTKLTTFCFLNLHTTVYDLPPMILTEEIHLDVPCTEREWQAPCATRWHEERSQCRDQQTFQDALRFLFQGPREGGTESFTSLGGYVLIHAIIQNIWFLQKTCRIPGAESKSLTASELIIFEQALERWCQCWEHNQESSIDFLSPHGPLSFTSAALLRFAYIRLNVDFSSARQLQTFNPWYIAQSLHDNVTVQRSDRLTRAALHCAHALSTPIKLGINFVAHTQVVLWSIQHALCSLECAVLLAKWLEVATAASKFPGSLTEQEAKLLDFVIEMALETQHEVDRDWLLQNSTRLSAAVTRLWARLFTADYIWDIVSLVGEALNRYADLLDAPQPESVQQRSIRS